MRLIWERCPYHRKLEVADRGGGEKNLLCRGGRRAFDCGEGASGAEQNRLAADVCRGCLHYKEMEPILLYRCPNCGGGDIRVSVLKNYYEPVISQAVFLCGGCGHREMKKIKRASGAPRE